ncbi:MAG: hypothetical protein WCJ29_03380 [bacterium]
MKVVISGSAKLQDEIAHWLKYWRSGGHEILDYPKKIPIESFEADYPRVHQEFYASIGRADILFIANERKNNIDGYIGPAAFAELAYGLAQKLVHGREVRLLLAREPSREVACFEEIVLWLKLGWVDVFAEI